MHVREFCNSVTTIYIHIFEQHENGRLGLTEVVMGGILSIFVPFFFLRVVLGGLVGGCRTDWHPQWEQSAGIVEVEKSSGSFFHDYSGLAAATTTGEAALSATQWPHLQLDWVEFLHSATSVDADPAVTVVPFQWIKIFQTAEWRKGWKTPPCRRLGWCCSCCKCSCTVALRVFRHGVRGNKWTTTAFLDVCVSNRKWKFVTAFRGEIFF